MGIYDVEIFWGALEQLHGSFSDQEFQKLEFVMPELLLKELWLNRVILDLKK